MARTTTRLVIAVCAAAALWFIMFSPWTSGVLNFWVMMSVSAVILSCFAISGTGLPDRKTTDVRAILFQAAVGIAIAFALWGIFWCGDKVSGLIFDFARPQIDSVYGMKEGSNPALITVLLLLLIGPAEEFFWRGYVQRELSEKAGPTAALFITTAIYALVHIWSFNFMLVMAALVAGGLWGLIYRLKPSLLPALIVSHALWDALIFIIMPI